MPTALWSGAISFGLVNIPVKLYPAVSRKDIQFNQLEETTGDRIRYKRVSEKSGREVPYERIVKGYEVDRGRYVVVTAEELEAIEPRSTRTLDVEEAPPRQAPAADLVAALEASLEAARKARKQPACAR
jgi:DNA end-binding protein Ku